VYFDGAVHLNQQGEENKIRQVPVRLQRIGENLACFTVRHFDIAKDTKQSIFKNVFYLSLRIHGRDSIRCQPWHLIKASTASL
jgi:hypothetical protein